MTSAPHDGRGLLSDEQLADIKARNPCGEIAAKWVTLRRSGGKLVGPCPLCSKNAHSRTAARFEVLTAESWVCAVCQDGGDVIRLVMKRQELDFRAAVEWLGGPQQIDPQEEARRAASRAAAEARRKADADKFRQRERRTLFDIWKAAVPLPGSPAEAYLRLRGIALPNFAAVRLRCGLNIAYFHGREDGADGRSHERVIHWGPAMIAPILCAGGGGLHFTFIDLDKPKGKAELRDPDTGKALPAKKCRGSKAGGHIALVGPPEPRRVIIGEGIETVLSVWLALQQCGEDADTAFWSSVDLGNLGGAALDRVTHPTELTAAGRPLRLPGAAPDLSAPGIVLPDSVAEVIELGDGDSDPVLTGAALVRGAARFRAARPDRVVRIAMAPPACDFNDILRGVA